MIPFTEEHLIFLLREYVHRYYNPARTHQGIERQTPILSKNPPKTLVAQTALVPEQILSGLYNYYRKTA